MVSRAHDLGREDILRALIIHSGVATANGAAAGDTLFDNSLIGTTDYITGKTILVIFSNGQYETLVAVGFNNTTGQITMRPTRPNPAQIVQGTAYYVLNIEPPQDGLVFWGRVSSVVSPTQFTCDMLAGKGNNFFYGWAVHCVRRADGTPAWPLLDEVACTAYVSNTGLFTTPAFIAALSVGDEIYMIHRDVAEIFKHGFIEYDGHATNNWNTGVATSGNPGADLTIIYGPCIVQNLVVSMRNLTPGANVTVRMYKDVHAIEEEIYNQTFIQGTDPNGIPVIDGVTGFYENVRIEVYSDQVADDGAQVNYQYPIERAH
jgi:hypothetical protein